MNRSLQFLVCLSLALPVPAAYSQTVAYVYVANNLKGTSSNEITAYSAASDGKLTLISGAPFRENVSDLAVNGKYLLALNSSQPVLDTFTIDPDGALHYVTSKNYSQYSTNHCAAAGQLFFDHTGSTLYAQEFNADCANTGVASFAVNKYSGGLSYLGLDITGAFPGDNTAAWFTGNNVYAYTAVNSACMYWAFYSFKRNSNGLLTSMTANFNPPATPSTFRVFVPELVTADPTGHLAVLMQPADPPGCVNKAPQLATYTVSSTGALHTTNTYANMPATSVVNPYDLKMAPSGLLLAVGGQQGLQIFHFNGANPITHDTGLLTSDPINQMFWDNANHLYAISQATGKLHVYTVTPTYAHEAWGSPYYINSPQHLIVQPLN